VVVGVDGTEGSIEALRWAAHEAARRRCPLHVITCAELPVAVEAGLVGTGVVDEATVSGMVADRRAVNERAVQLARTFGLALAVSGEVVVGSAGYAITGSTEPDDIVVVGATSHPGRLTDVLGSVATMVAHRARGPVVVVHGTERRDAAIARILVGVDGSPGSDAALEWAVEEAFRCSAELTLVHGWTYPYVGPRTGISEPRNEMRLDAMRTLEASAKLAKDLAPSLRCHPIVCEQGPAAAILASAREADLVVVGSRGLGGFASLVMGSVSRTVLQHSPVPVVVVPSRA
jgi:nucleotide-binding universal stress UspA family protein